MTYYRSGSPRSSSRKLSDENCAPSRHLAVSRNIPVYWRSVDGIKHLDVLSPSAGTRIPSVGYKPVVSEVLKKQYSGSSNSFSSPSAYDCLVKLPSAIGSSLLCFHCFCSLSPIYLVLIYVRAFPCSLVV